jgi:hypothetical protein
MSVESEEFEQWLEHPFTRALMIKSKDVQAACKQAWEALSWGAPINELPAKLPLERLAYLRGKSDAFASLSALKYRDLFKESKNDEGK